ncbi:MAG: alpha/beta hydrolase [Desulfobulbaceae bacterium]|nr:alpha/beta hydrolase [Desulfobulbaceae bacterium]
MLAELQRLNDKEGVHSPKVGIYLHGYNNDYQDSIDEIFDLENSLEELYGHSPVIVGFSWPSSGKTVNYLSDRDEVRDSVGAFTRFLIDINELATQNEKDCFSTTFCIAHSMGNYLLRKGLEYLSDYLGGPTTACRVFSKSNQWRWLDNSRGSRFLGCHPRTLGEAGPCDIRHPVK